MMLLPGLDLALNIAFENSYMFGFYMRELDIENLICITNEYSENWN